MVKFFVVTLLATALAFAAPVGSIKGYVQEATGAFVTNASIDLQNELTNQTSKTPRASRLI